MSQYELHSLPLSLELLEYYRQRLIKGESEFQDAVERIDDINISHKKYHDITRTILQKDNELDELKKSLSGAQLAVFEERKHLLRVMAENDELKVRELQDRKKIQYLLALSGPSSSEDGTAYFKHRVPKSIVKGAQVHEDKDNEAQEVPLSAEMHKVEREIEKQSFTLRINALQTQLEEQTINYDAHLKQLKNENLVSLDDLQIQNARLKKQLEDTLNENEKLRHISRENIKELLTIKRDFKKKERLLVEEKTIFYDEKNSLASKVVDLEQQYRQVEKIVETKYLKNQESVISSLKDTINRIQIENKGLKETIEKYAAKYSKLSDVMRKRMDNISSNYLALKKRRHFEIEGFTNDIIALRKQLKVLEKSILKYAPIADKEFMLLNIARQTGMKVESLSGNLNTIKNTLYQFETDLEANRF